MAEQPSQLVTPQKITHELTFNDAAKLAEGYAEKDLNLDYAQEYFKKTLASAGDTDYEKRAQIYYYLLRIQLRGGNAFETPMLHEYFCNMKENFELAATDLEKQALEAEDKNKKKLHKSQIKAFYKMIEKDFRALEQIYEEKGFVEALDRTLVFKLQFRKRRYFLEQEYGKMLSLMMMETFTCYGTSLFRWSVSVVFLIFLFAALFAVTDLFTGTMLFPTGSTFGFDYLYLSFVSFTSFGLADVQLSGVLLKLLVMLETMFGYLMFGLFIVVISRRR